LLQAFKHIPSQKDPYDQEDGAKSSKNSEIGAKAIRRDHLGPRPVDSVTETQKNR